VTTDKAQFERLVKKFAKAEPHKRGRKKNMERVVQILELRAKGQTYAQIGRTLGVSHSAACATLRNAFQLPVEATDLTGKRFGRLVAVHYSESRNGHSYWFCLCGCGSHVIVRAQDLTAKHTRSCGCLQKEVVRKRNTPHGRVKDLRGQKFGRLQPLRYMIRKKAWLCLCDCGATTIVAGGRLRSGVVRSCGCLRRDHMRQVGLQRRLKD